MLLHCLYRWSLPLHLETACSGVTAYLHLYIAYEYNYPPVNFITVVTPVSSCLTQNTNTVAKISALKEEVAQVVDAVCSCNFNASDIVSASFSCKNPGADIGEAVVLRMTVREKNGFGAPSAVMAVSEWASDAPSITINLVQYTVSSSCPTELSSETDPDCGPSPEEGSNSMSIIIGSSVAAGVVTLILVVAIVVMVIWMCRRSSKAKYETDEYVVLMTVCITS